MVNVYLKIREISKSPLQKYRCFAKKLELVVIRTDKEGQLRNSKPCKHCLETLKFFGIKMVYYSTEEGGVEKIKTNELEPDHLSSRQVQYYRFLRKKDQERSNGEDNKTTFQLRSNKEKEIIK